MKRPNKLRMTVALTLFILTTACAPIQLSNIPLSNSLTEASLKIQPEVQSSVAPSVQPTTTQTATTASSGSPRSAPMATPATPVTNIFAPLLTINNENQNTLQTHANNTLNFFPNSTQSPFTLPPDKKMGLLLTPKDKLKRIPMAAQPSVANLPTNFDLSANLPPIGNQGEQNSCVGWATSYGLKSYQETSEEKHPMLMSPSFVYNQINGGIDRGASFADAFNLLATQGTPTMADMPYLVTDFTSQPSPEVRKIAYGYKLRNWRRVNIATNEIKAQLAANNPVVIGVEVYPDFFNLGPNVLSSLHDNSIGSYHAVVVVAYDDNKQAFKIMNSWGENWGEQGFGWIDYQVFNQITAEAYIAQDDVNPVPSPVVTPTPVITPTPSPTPDITPTPSPTPTITPTPSPLPPIVPQVEKLADGIYVQSGLPVTTATDTWRQSEPIQWGIFRPASVLNPGKDPCDSNNDLSVQGQLQADGRTRYSAPDGNWLFAATASASNSSQRWWSGPWLSIDALFHLQGIQKTNTAAVCNGTWLVVY